MLHRGCVSQIPSHCCIPYVDATDCFVRKKQSARVADGVKCSAGILDVMSVVLFAFAESGKPTDFRVSPGTSFRRRVHAELEMMSSSLKVPAVLAVGSKDIINGVNRAALDCHDFRIRFLIPGQPFCYYSFTFALKLITFCLSRFRRIIIQNRSPNLFRCLIVIFLSPDHELITFSRNFAQAMKNSVSPWAKPLLLYQFRNFAESFLSDRN